MASRTTRRTFVKHIAYAGAAAPLFAPPLLRAEPANSKLNVAFVGTGGRAKAHTGAAHGHGLNCVAFAEVDKGHWGGVLGKKGWEDAKGYTDWRKIFENHAKSIDVMFVATPDHTHFAPTMTAISMGIHCYTEKPLTWSVREAQLLEQAYLKNPKVVTQMGNQGHAGQGWRIAYEFVATGAFGDIKEFHTWTNRPIWPQGGDRPEGSDPVPDNLDWESWIGCAPMRPFKKGVYHPFKWRGFWDFGAGALGDMACHTTDGIHAIMKPTYPTSVEPIFVTGKVTDQYQAGATFRYEYPANDGKPAFSVFWYEGKGPDGGENYPPVPDNFDMKLPRTGNLMIGTKGSMLITGDYWNSPRPFPKEFAAELKKPEQLLERSPGHHNEFFMACKGEKPREFSRSNFAYSGPMTAKIQLGNISAKVGRKLKIDPKTGEIQGDKEAAAYVWREPRDNWGPMESIVALAT